MAGTFVTDSAAVNPFDAATKTSTSSVTGQPVREVTFPKGQAALEVNVPTAVAGTGSISVEVWVADTAASATSLGADAHRAASTTLNSTAGTGGATNDKVTVPFYSNKRYLQVRTVVTGTVTGSVLSARIVEQHTNRKRAGQPA